MDCTDANGNDQFRLVGDAHGNMPETKWNIIANGYSKSGGPFQWFHRYIRKVDIWPTRIYISLSGHEANFILTDVLLVMNVQQSGPKLMDG